MIKKMAVYSVAQWQGRVLSYWAQRQCGRLGDGQISQPLTQAPGFTAACAVMPVGPVTSYCSVQVNKQGLSFVHPTPDF
ncbi:hypothetical protein J6590_003406 [Homalodisca vitripennis]|nr:hypothetical protein J6590_003406 [Homalodisca vitripennis]